MSKEQTGDQVFTVEDMEKAQERWVDYSSDLCHRIQILVDYLDELGYLEDGIFSWEDGEMWVCSRLAKEVKEKNE